MDEKLDPKDKALLMRDEGEGNNLKVVKGIDKKGKITAIDPVKAKQSDFLIIDRHADPIENFFNNFMNQAKNPSHTGFYAVTVDMIDKVLKLTDKELENFRVNPKDLLNQRQEKPETKTKELTNENKDEMKPTAEQKANEQKAEFKPLETSRIPDSEYREYNISPDNLRNELNAMSYGYKSPRLVDIAPNIDGVEYPMKARLSLEEQPDGSLKIIPHPFQQQVDLEKPFHGVILPNDVKENLLATGNGGRVIDLEPKPGEIVPSFISIDKLTNRLEAVPADKLNVSQKLKGVELSPEQQQSLKEGKKVLVEGMVSRQTIGTDNPLKFDAHVQFNSAKGGYNFSYEGLDRNRYRQDNRQGRDQNQAQGGEQQNKVRIPNKLLGKSLTPDQQDKLRDNKSVYVQGMVKDGQEQPFNAYVKVNHEKGKLDFYKWNPDRARKQGAEVKPADESKTQVAVNTQGKTNEATKHANQPLKQSQQGPTESQHQQQNNRRTVKKTTGQKM